MKKFAYLIIALALIACFVGAAQDTTIDPVQVRDPLQLEVWLEANASDAQTRLAANEARFAVSTMTTITTNAYVLTSANYGSSILVNTNAAVAITLPANGAAVGSWVEVGVIGTDDCAPTISAATADTLIGPNDIDLDSVTWATGHRINALARFWSDGAKWHVLNLGGTTMTYTD